MGDEYFSEEVAKNLIGLVVANNREFSGIRKYTIGKVSGTYSVEGFYGILVRWETESGGVVEDGFSKDEFEKFLEVTFIQIGDEKIPAGKVRKENQVEVFE